MLMQLADPVIALDFDNAAAMRLQQWEDERTAAFFGAQQSEVRLEA